jgi:hypothetical protein
MRDYLDFLMAESLALRGRIFWNYVWSLADLDAEVSAALTQFMTLYRSLFAMLIRRVNPSLSPRDANRLAAALSSMIDGLGSVVGEGRPADAELAGLDDMVKALALRIALDPPR